MAIVRVQVAIERSTGLSEDVVTNTFHYETPSVASSVLEDLSALTAHFYTDVPTGNGAALQAHLSPELVGPLTIRCYDLADATPRVPLRVEEFTLSAGELQPLPDEVAVVCSFQGGSVSGVPQARRRGRLFIGPLNIDALNVASGRAVPDPDIISILKSSMKDLQDGAAALGISWGVYSPTDNELVPATNGWVDNDFDTIRKRGRVPTERNVITF